MNDNASVLRSAPFEFVSLISDLGFSVKVRSVATARGRTSTNVRSLRALIETVGPLTKGIVLDLAHAESMATLEWLQARTDGIIPVLAFYPHVESEIGAAAATFSFVQISTRSKFDAALLRFIPPLVEDRRG